MLTIKDAVYVKDTASPTNTDSPIASYILADITGDRYQPPAEARRSCAKFHDTGYSAD